MTNETISGLKRVSWLPDRDALDNGTIIAGQEYDDVEFIGGAISNVDLTDVTINGVETARNERVVTVAGAVTVASDDYVIIINKTVPEITTVTLPASPSNKRSLIIKDGAGNADTYNITINGNGHNIDEAATYVIATDWASVEIIYNSTNSMWEIIGQARSAGTGTVTSVAMTGDNVIYQTVVTGSPISSTGTLIPVLKAVTAKSVLGNPTAGALAAVFTTDPVVSGAVTGNTLVSTVATGTAPLTVASTTQVANLYGARAVLADTITVADTASATCNVGLFEAAAGNLAAKTDAALTYNASTGILSATGFNGPITGAASQIGVVDAAADTTTWVLLAGAQTGNQPPLSDAGLTYDASTNALTATTFIGALTGNAATATTVTNIATSAEAADTSCFPVFVTASGTQTLPAKTNAGLTYNSSTNNLGATGFTGALTGNASTATALATARAIYGNNFDGTAALTQVIASTYGGTGNGFTAFTGPTTSEKTFTLPNASSTILTSNAAVTVAQGGTGLATLTANNVILGNGTSTPSFVAPSTSGNILTSNGTTWTSAANASKFTLEFTSSDQTITSGGSLTLAHGLGVVPKLVQLLLICQTGEFGFTAGDIVLTNFGLIDQTPAIVINATNVLVRYGSSGSAFLTTRFDTGASASLTNGNWRFRVKAWA